MLTGAQNNRKLWLMFCIIVESNSQKTFYSFVLYSNNINVNLLLVQRCQVKTTYSSVLVKWLNNPEGYFSVPKYINHSL